MQCVHKFTHSVSSLCCSLSQTYTEPPQLLENLNHSEMGPHSQGVTKLQAGWSSNYGLILGTGDIFSFSKMHRLVLGPTLPHMQQILSVRVQ
jgi:hypothetical protein